MSRVDLEALGMSDEQLSEKYTALEPSPDRLAPLHSYDADTPERQAQRREMFRAVMRVEYQTDVPP